MLFGDVLRFVVFCVAYSVVNYLKCKLSRLGKERIFSVICYLWLCDFYSKRFLFKEVSFSRLRYMIVAFHRTIFV